MDKEKKKRKTSIITEVAVLFLIGVLATGILTYLCEKGLSGRSVKKQMTIHAGDIAGEVSLAVKEYPAWKWLIRYWYSHPDTLEIEYDAEFSEETQTAEKYRIFSSRHPDQEIRYLNEEQCKLLSPEDQKLYAEIVYSWLITRINQIKQCYHVSFLFCVVSEEPFDRQFFLFSAADPGAVRGTDYEEVYPLGHVVSVTESQTSAMREAVQNSSHLADAGKYVDYYAPLWSFDRHSVLFGLTYDLSALRDDIEMQTRTGASIAILNQLILSLISLALISVFVLRPLRRVQFSIRQYKETKDSRVVTSELALIDSVDEIGQLAEDVSQMAGEIDDYMGKIRSITAEKERISTELALATRIQADMLPNIYPAFPDRPEFDIYACMEPAREVGGDFYDFFLTDEDHLCIVMADVSGKGVPAALFMMASKIILANNAMMGKTPAQILSDTNASICSNNREEMFVTVWLGILEISTGMLTAASAGHEYPVLRRGDGEFELYQDKHGLVIGALETSGYKDYQLQMEPGDRLFVYTDGVPEATSADDSMFGTDRMLAALNNAGNGSPQQILGHVRQIVDDFVQGAEQFDDLTMLCLEYRKV